MGLKYVWTLIADLVDTMIRQLTSLFAVFTFIGSPIGSYGMDLHIPGKTLKQALSEISSASGVTCLAAADVENEVVYLRAKGVELNSVMSALSKAAGLSWIKEGDGFRLGRYGVAGTNLKSEHIQVEGDRLEPAIRGLGETSERGLDFDYVSAFREQVAAGQGRGQINRLSPLNDAVYALLRMERGETLASIEPNTRVVFSSAPTARQRRMSASMNIVVEKSAVSYRKLLSEMATFSRAQNNRTGASQAQDYEARLNRPISKANITVTNKGGVYRLSLTFVDRQGLSIDGVSTASIEPDNTVAGTNQRKFVWPEVKVATDPLIRDLAMTAVSFDRSVRFRDRTLDQLLEKAKEDNVNSMPYSAGPAASSISSLLDPVACDPTGRLVAEALSSLPDPNIVAVIPDSAAGYIGGSFLTGDSRKIFGGYADVVDVSADGWRILKPADPLGAQQARFDREALKTVLSTMSRQFGMLSISDLVAYAMKNGSTVPANRLDTALVAWLFGGSMAAPLNRTHDDGWYDHLVMSREVRQSATTTLRQLAGLHEPLQTQFYNSTRSPSGGANVEALSSLPILGTSFGDRAGARAEASVTGQFVEIRDAVQVTNGSQVEMLVRRDLANLELQRAATQRIRPDERTDRLPTGLPIDGQVTIQVGSTPMLLAIDRKRGQSMTFDADAFARLSAQANYGGSATYPSSPEVFDLFLPIVSEYKTVALTIEPQYQTSATVVGERPNGSPVTYDQLPQSLRNDIARRAQQYDKQFADRLGNAGSRRDGRTIPPRQ